MSPKDDNDNSTNSHNDNDNTKTNLNKNQPRPLNLLKYHRPKTLPLNRSPIPQLSKTSKSCLKSLSSYRIPNSALRNHVYPRSRSAAVLVALFVGRHGDLYVLLSRRSSSLRSYAGDTSLPGGKVEAGDRTLEDTARREAFEEIGLPRDRAKVPLLCVLEPWLASNSTVVTPVVVLILDNTLRPILNQAEVTSLFSHPLSSFLSSSAPFPTEPETIQLPYHTYIDHEWPGRLPGARTGSGTGFTPDPNANTSAGAGKVRTVGAWQVGEDDEDGNADVVNDGMEERRKVKMGEGKSDEREGRGVVRLHRFLTGREAGGVKPVFGLTASILIRVSSIAHARLPTFPIHPPPILTPTHYTFTPSMEQRIAHEIIDNPQWRAAYQNEGFIVRDLKSEVNTRPTLSNVDSRRVVDWDLLRKVADWKRHSGWGVVDGRLISGSGNDKHIARKRRRRGIGWVKSRL